MPLRANSTAASSSACGLVHDAIEFSLVDLAALEHELFEFDDRAFLFPRLDLRLGTIAGRAEESLLADHMALPSVGLALQQRRPIAGPRPRDRFAGVAIDFEHVVAVDDLAGNRVALRAHRDILDRGHGLHRGEFAEAVVLADENHRQFPDRGEVERFVKGALVGGAVAEEAGGDVVAPRDLRGQRRAGRDRQARADDPVGAQDAEREVDYVHRAALALAVAFALAVELGHHAVEPATLGDQMAVAAMGRSDAVGLAQRRANAGRARLFADRNVHEARNLAGDREVAHPPLELPNPLHRAVHLEHHVFAEVHR